MQRLLGCGEEAFFGLPAIVLYAADPAAVEHVVQQIASKLDGGAFASAPATPPSTEPRQRWTPKGSLSVECAGGASNASSDAVLSVAKGISRQPRIERTRRLVVLKDVGCLAQHTQHALRKELEDSMASTLFAMTARRTAEVDAALLSRALVVNCTGAAPGAGLELRPAGGGAGLVAAIRAARTARGKRAAATAGRGVAGAVRAAAAAGALPECLRAAVDACAGDGCMDDGALRALVGAAAAADHLHAAARRSKEAVECVARALLAALAAEGGHLRRG